MLGQNSAAIREAWSRGKQLTGYGLTDRVRGEGKPGGVDLYLFKWLFSAGKISPGVKMQQGDLSL